MTLQRGTRGQGVQEGQEGQGGTLLCQSPIPYLLIPAHEVAQLLKFVRSLEEQSTRYSSSNPANLETVKTHRNLQVIPIGFIDITFPTSETTKP